jgi:hypothetical protein
MIEEFLKKGQDDLYLAGVLSDERGTATEFNFVLSN